MNININHTYVYICIQSTQKDLFYLVKFYMSLEFALCKNNSRDHCLQMRSWLLKRTYPEKLINNEINCYSTK